MDLKQLKTFTTVVEYRSFTEAAKRLYLSQPTISTHIRMLEEELSTRLIVRTTKNIEVTPRGKELYECAVNMLALRDNLLQRWENEQNRIIHLGVSTIPSAYILPEILPKYGKLHPETYFIIHQSDSAGVAEGVQNGNFDIGMVGMRCENELLECVPFYRDRMVLVTPIEERFLKYKQQPEVDFYQLLREPIILREQGSGTKKSMDFFLKTLDIREEQLQVTARINDQESIKNLVAGGLGVSIISERAAHNLVEEKRILAFELPEESAERNLYVVYRKDYILKKYMEEFLEYVKSFY
ncbi:MAG: selenium metabolism-associated LysR family transcriptional regulator [Lachnospiraceae bacterium]